jgi:hypothetical protein
MNGRLIDNELEKCGRSQSLPNFRSCTDTFLKFPRKTTKALSQDILSRGQDLNLGPPKYNTEVFPTDYDVGLRIVLRPKKDEVGSIGCSMMKNLLSSKGHLERYDGLGMWLEWDKQILVEFW